MGELNHPSRDAGQLAVELQAAALPQFELHTVARQVAARSALAGYYADYIEAEVLAAQMAAVAQVQSEDLADAEHTALAVLVHRSDQTEHLTHHLLAQRSLPAQA